MEASCTVDWLSVSYAWDSVPTVMHDGDHTALTLIQSWLELPGEMTLDKPRYGFTFAVKAHDGVTLYLSEPDSQQGIHVVYPGSTLTPVRALRVLAHARNKGGKITRIDVTVDIRGGTDTVETYRDLYEAGKYIGYPRTYTLLTGSKGATLYIGARSSEKFMRIYDKAAQQGTDEKWLRVELECKGAMARAVAWNVTKGGIKLIPNIIAGFVSFDTVEWKQAMNEAGKAIHMKGSKKLTDTKKWLFDTIAPFLAKLNQTDPTTYAEFMDYLTSLIDSTSV